MKSYLPLIIFGLFFIGSLIGFAIFRKREEEQDAKSEVTADQDEAPVE
ncbi:MAG TPA: hypothetical protein VK174_04315 [Chitinophagales bacterium]|nr:hypothetical protein [Chitinophagales bacterium]